VANDTREGKILTSPYEWLSDPSLGLVVETRPLQVNLTKYLSNQLSMRHPSLIEAGTGIGKSFAYLLPAIEQAERGNRVVISTAMKSLQQQLYFKDLPYLSTKMSVPPFARHLGKANYGCKRKVALNVYGRAQEEAYDAFFDSTKHWVWGDASEEIAKALPDDHWKHSVAYCSGDRCDYVDECRDRGYLAAKDASEVAKILVVNHALVGADIRVDAQHDVKILGNYQMLIVDEAHKYPEAIRNALTCQMPAAFFDKAVHQYHELVGAFRSDMAVLTFTKDVDHVPQHLPNIPLLQAAYRNMFREVARTDNYGDASKEFARLARDSVTQLDESCDVLHPAFRSFLVGRDEYQGHVCDHVWPEMRNSIPLMSMLTYLNEFTSKLQDFAGAIDLAAEHKLKYVVTVLENGQGVSELHTIPIDVGERLQKFYETRAVVPNYLSATLTVNDSFEHFADEVGHDLIAGSTFHAGSPFDFKKQAWCYAPSHIPEPTAGEAYTAAVVDECYSLLMANEGHAFILFTSYRELDAVDAGLRRKGYPYPLLKQNAQLKARGREIFLATPNATLLGTRTFWEGIDIPGLALTLVIIPKIPFPTPSDPVIKAKSAIAGDKWFFDVSLPAALIDLRQMAGRLIRSMQDRGVVAILDTRVHTKRYGKQIVGAIGFPWSARRDIPIKLLEQLAVLRKKQQGTT
jgi:ATP-dependent DNA helicase DinG